jgi:hypothetical protein
VCDVVDQNHEAQGEVKWRSLVSGSISHGKVAQQTLSSQEAPCSMDDDTQKGEDDESEHETDNQI